MKVSEVIHELQKLKDKYGDKEFHIYLSYSKTTNSNVDIFYDDSEEDICIGTYG